MRVVCYDIETTDLAGLMGRVLCCSFLPIAGDVTGEEVVAYITGAKTQPQFEDAA